MLIVTGNLGEGNKKPPVLQKTEAAGGYEGETGISRLY